MRSAAPSATFARSPRARRTGGCAQQTMSMLQAAEAHRQLESGTVHERIILTL
jgi:hypothetical protein